MKTRVDQSRIKAFKQINSCYRVALAEKEKEVKDFNNNINAIKKELLEFYKKYLEQRKGMGLTIRQKLYGKVYAVSADGTDYGNYFSTYEGDLRSLAIYQNVVALIESMTDLKSAVAVSEALNKILNPPNRYYYQLPIEQPHGTKQPRHINKLLEKLESRIAVTKKPAYKLNHQILNELSNFNVEVYGLTEKFYPSRRYYGEVFYPRVDEYNRSYNLSVYFKNERILKSSSAYHVYDVGEGLELNIGCIHGSMQNTVIRNFERTITKKLGYSLEERFECKESEARSLLSAPVLEPSAPPLLSSAARIMSVVGISPSVKESEEVEDQPGLLKSAEKIAEIEKIRANAFKLDESLAVYDEYQPGLRALR